LIVCDDNDFYSFTNHPGLVLLNLTRSQAVARIADRMPHSRL